MFAKKRHVVRDANFEKLDQACYLWFIQQCSKGGSSFWAEKASQLFLELDPDKTPDSFKASSGTIQYSTCTQ